MSEEKIIDKIRKLMTLANSANEHEAALAAARATELMLKHEIAEAQLQDAGSEELGEVDEESVDETGAIVPWKGNLAGGLAMSQGCEFYYGLTKFVRGGPRQRRLYMIIGQESKRATIKYMYQYLCAELIRLGDIAFRKAILKHRKEAAEYEASGLAFDVRAPSARAWKNAFRLGAASMIWKRLNKQREETHEEAKDAGQTQALVVVAANAEAVQVFKKGLGKMGKGRGGSFSSGTGYAHGREAGKSVGLGGGGKALGRGGTKQLGTGS